MIFGWVLSQKWEKIWNGMCHGNKVMKVYQEPRGSGEKQNKVSTERLGENY